MSVNPPGYGSLTNNTPDLYDPVALGRRTAGGWQDEQASCQAFDAAVPRGFWSVEQEVPGFVAHYAPWQQPGSNVRIDRVLVPTPALCALGWPGWAVGVEIKRSGIPCGPPLAQAMDYVRSAFYIQGVPQYLQWVFVWPLQSPSGPLASLMVHHHVGSAWLHRDQLELKVGESTVFGFDWQGRPKVGRNLARLGVGVGSR